MVFESKEQRVAKGTQTYAFDFGRLRRGQLQQKIEDMYTQYEHHPLEGAEQLLALFDRERHPRNFNLLRDEPEVQDTILGSHEHKGPVAHFLEQVSSQQEEMAQVPAAMAARFAAACTQHEQLLSQVETARILEEDPKGTNRYALSWSRRPLTSSEVRQAIEDTLIQYDARKDYIGAAKALLEMFSRPEDRQVLRESLRLRHEVLGGIRKISPIDFCLDKANEQLEQRGTSGHVARMQIERLDALEQAYAGLCADVLAEERQQRDTPDKPPAGAEGHVERLRRQQQPSGLSGQHSLSN